MSKSARPRGAWACRDGRLWPHVPCRGEIFCGALARGGLTQRLRRYNNPVIIGKRLILFHHISNVKPTVTIALRHSTGDTAPGEYNSRAQTRATASDATREKHERHHTNEWHERRLERRLPDRLAVWYAACGRLCLGLQLDLLRKELASPFHCLVELVQLKLLCARNVRERILLLLASFQIPQVLPVASVPIVRGGQNVVHWRVAALARHGAGALPGSSTNSAVTAEPSAASGLGRVRLGPGEIKPPCVRAAMHE